jgi:hypothetical protein
MDIQSLRLRVTDADVKAILASFQPEDAPIEDLLVRLTPEGVIVQGEYPALMMKVAFETVWEVSAAGPAVAVRLAHVKVAGLPAGVLRGVLLRMVRDATVNQAAIHVTDDTLRVHLEELAQAHGTSLRVNLTRVVTGDGWLTVEAGEK